MIRTLSTQCIGHTSHPATQHILYLYTELCQCVCVSVTVCGGELVSHTRKQRKGPGGWDLGGGLYCTLGVLRLSQNWINIVKFVTKYRTVKWTLGVTREPSTQVCVLMSVCLRTIWSYC